MQFIARFWKGMPLDRRPSKAEAGPVGAGAEGSLLTMLLTARQLLFLEGAFR